jgi:low affinity Fe/Cu permease
VVNKQSQRGRARKQNRGLVEEQDQDADFGAYGGAWFSRFAGHISRLAGKPSIFASAVALVIVWAASGPFLGFSDVWQLTINTATTIITFLMVFVIQNTQNRDTAAMHIKLDELIRATKAAHNSLLDLEELSDEELDTFRTRYEELAKQAKSKGQIVIEEVPKQKTTQRKAARQS